MANRTRRSSKPAAKVEQPEIVDPENDEIEDNIDEEDHVESNDESSGEDEGEDLDFFNDQTLWPPSKEEQLISMYEEASYLWNAAVEGYKVKAKRERALTRFAKKLGISVAMVETRISTLRRAYSNYKNGPKSGSGRTDLTPRQKYIVDKMSFLNTHVKGRKSKASYNPKEKDTKLMQQAIEAQAKALLEAKHKAEMLEATNKTSTSEVIVIGDGDPESRQPVFDGDVSPSREVASNSDDEIIPPSQNASNIVEKPKGGNSKLSLKKVPPKKRKNIAEETDNTIKPLPGTSEPPKLGRNATRLQQLAAANLQKNTRPRGRPPKNPSNAQVNDLLEKRNDLLTEMTSVITSQNDPINPINQPPVLPTPPIPMMTKSSKDDDDPVELWARHLATKIRRLDTDIRDEVMVNIDCIVLTSLKESKNLSMTPTTSTTRLITVEDSPPHPAPTATSSQACIESREKIFRSPPRFRRFSYSPQEDTMRYNQGFPRMSEQMIRGTPQHPSMSTSQVPPTSKSAPPPMFRGPRDYDSTSRRPDSEKYMEYSQSYYDPNRGNY